MSDTAWAYHPTPMPPAVEADIRARHRAVNRLAHYRQVCATCGTPYPCPVVRALEGDGVASLGGRRT